MVLLRFARLGFAGAEWPTIAAAPVSGRPALGPAQLMLLQIDLGAPWRAEPARSARVRPHRAVGPQPDGSSPQHRTTYANLALRHEAWRRPRTLVLRQAAYPRVNPTRPSRRRT